MGTALLFASVQSMRRAVSSLDTAPSIGRGVVGDSTGSSGWSWRKLIRSLHPRRFIVCFKTTDKEV